MKSKNTQSFREQMKERVWTLLEEYKQDSSFAKQCVVRDEIVSLICDSMSSWQTKSIEMDDDWSESKEKWIAR